MRNLALPRCEEKDRYVELEFLELCSARVPYIETRIVAKTFLHASCTKLHRRATAGFLSG